MAEKTNVLSFGGAMPAQMGEPQVGLIGALEDALEMAKSGRLQSFVGTGFTSDGDRLTVRGGHHEDVYQMLGALAWLQHEYVDRTTDKVE